MYVSQYVLLNVNPSPKCCRDLFWPSLWDRSRDRACPCRWLPHHIRTAAPQSGDPKTDAAAPFLEEKRLQISWESYGYSMLYHAISLYIMLSHVISSHIISCYIYETGDRKLRFNGMYSWFMMAKLVNISPIIMVHDMQIPILFLGFWNQLRSGRPPIARSSKKNWQFSMV